MFESILAQGHVIRFRLFRRVVEVSIKVHVCALHGTTSDIVFVVDFTKPRWDSRECCLAEPWVAIKGHPCAVFQRAEIDALAAPTVCTASIDRERHVGRACSCAPVTIGVCRGLCLSVVNFDTAVRTAAWYIVWGGDLEAVVTGFHFPCTGALAKVVAALVWVGGVPTIALGTVMNEVIVVFFAAGVTFPFVVISCLRGSYKISSIAVSFLYFYVAPLAVKNDGLRG